MYMADKSDHLFRGEIDHSPWMLRDAQAIVHRNTMADSLGIDVISSEPLCHFALKTKVVAWGKDAV